MVERGKRNHNRTDNNRNQKRRITDEKTDTSKDDLTIAYRILCPVGVIGSVIGKSGKVINSIRQETRARIKIVDPFPNCTERVITIYCSIKEKKEIIDIENNESNFTTDSIIPLCSAQDALIKVHEAIVNSIATAAENTKISRDDLRECRILVPASQCSNVIGKSGSTVKKIRSKTRALVKIVSKDGNDPSHICAMDFDNIVMISGEAEAVKKGIYAVSSICYKFNPREQIPLDTSVTVQEVLIQPDLSLYAAQTGLHPNPEIIFPHGSFFGTLPQSSSRSEKLVVKVLCSSSNIGRVIGKGGSTIKGIRQASGSQIEVNAWKGKCDDDCVIVVTSKESPDDLKSMAVEAVLLLQEKINDEDEEKVKMQLLVPSKVIGCIIGKSGSIISEIRKRTNADIYISKGSSKPKCADPDDELVEISSEVGSVRDALIQIVLRLRDDVLRDRESVGPVGSSRNQRSESNGYFPLDSFAMAQPYIPSVPQVSALEYVPRVASLDYDRRTETGTSLGLGMISSSGGIYGYGSFSGDNRYGSDSSYSYGGLPKTSTTVEIRIPASAVGKVVGKGGGNLDNIRRISGAIIELSDSKNSYGERIALISGTPEQKRSAENLFQAFIMST